jgi:hypothetical protein
MDTIAEDILKERTFSFKDASAEHVVVDITFHEKDVRAIDQIQALLEEKASTATVIERTPTSATLLIRKATKN